MTLVTLMFGAFLGFLAGVLAMSLLRVAAFDPPIPELLRDAEGAGRDRQSVSPGDRGISKQ